MPHEAHDRIGEISPRQVNGAIEHHIQCVAQIHGQSHSKRYSNFSLETAILRLYETQRIAVFVSR